MSNQKVLADKEISFRSSLEKLKVASRIWLLLGIVVASIGVFFFDKYGAPFLSSDRQSFVAAVILLLPFLGFGISLRFVQKNENLWRGYLALKKEVLLIQRLSKTSLVIDLERRIANEAETNDLVGELWNVYSNVIHQRKIELNKIHRQLKLDLEILAFTSGIDQQIDAAKNASPVLRALRHLKENIAYLNARRAELDAQWSVAYESFSWWNKLTQPSADFSELDALLAKLKRIHSSLSIRHSNEISAINKHFDLIRLNSTQRVMELKEVLEDEILNLNRLDAMGDRLLIQALIFSALSLPLSIWNDVDRASEIYEVLRRVNSNFEGLTETEIWWETLLMPSESVAGLAALAKGAYLEHLVAEDMGGTLFEHFNHPNTDIIVDGVAYQIKATDSESYIASVADGIPVISTSEVAQVRGAIDAGYTNEELDESVNLALSGPVIDFSDASVDALLSGIGGLGVLATISGINHAVEAHKNGGEAVESAFEGLGVAIEGTARGLVNAAELGTKVGTGILLSRPSRFIGRSLRKGLQKLDNKLMS